MWNHTVRKEGSCPPLPSCPKLRVGPGLFCEPIIGAKLIPRLPSLLPPGLVGDIYPRRQRFGDQQEVGWGRSGMTLKAAQGLKALTRCVGGGRTRRRKGMNHRVV